MTDLSAYWKNFPDTSTPVEASVLNEWGGQVEAVRDEAIAARDAAQNAAAEASAPADDQIATLLATPGSATRVQADEAYLVGNQDTGLAQLLTDGYSDTRDALDSLYSGPKPAVTVSRLPGYLNATFCWNGVAFIQDNVTTVQTPFGVRQYAVWVDSDRHVKLGWRSIEERTNGSWQIRDLFSTPNTAFGAIVTQDVHNVLAIGVDASGYIHIAGDMHNVAVKYMRSTAPWDTTTWTTANPPTTGTSTSYPMFLKTNSGLMYWYREGVSGNGNVMAATWNGTAWGAPSQVISGTATGENPYIHHIGVERQNSANPGRIHLMWDWRESGASADTNTDPSYAYSDDGVTWYRTGGVQYTLPINHGTCEIAVDVPQGSGIHAMGGFDVDTNGLPHYSNVKYDAGGKTQIWHVWFDGSSWQNQFVTTDLNYTMDMSVPVASEEVARPSVVCTASGRTLILWRTNYSGRRGYLWCSDVTDGVPRPAFPLVDLEMYYYEPTFDTRALVERNELAMMLAPLSLDTSSAEYVNATQWIQQAGWIATWDLDRLGEIATSRAPGIRPVASVHIPTTTTTATTATDLGVGQYVVGPEGRRQLFARLVTRSNGNANTGLFTAQLVEHVFSPASNTVRATLTYTSDNITASPWVPLSMIGGATGMLGWTAVFGFAATGTGRIAFGRVEIGEFVP